MSRTPSITPKRLVAALKRVGYTELRQSGSHLILVHPVREMVIVPMHAKDLSRPLMIRILKQSKLEPEDL